MFWTRIALTWCIILAETGLLALIPLVIGLAIDDLLVGKTVSFWQLAGIMALLIGLSVIRRAYDTRVYGAVRVELGKAQVQRASGSEVSTLNARIAMGRELVDFLEDILPEALAAGVQLLVSVAILYTFSPSLALAAAGATLCMILIYAASHHRLYCLNAALNQQTEMQVTLLERRTARPMLSHFLRLRRYEVRLSDAEALLYGAIFIAPSGDDPVQPSDCDGLARSHCRNDLLSGQLFVGGRRKRPDTAYAPAKLDPTVRDHVAHKQRRGSDTAVGVS